MRRLLLTAGALLGLAVSARAGSPLTESEFLSAIEGPGPALAEPGADTTAALADVRRAGRIDNPILAYDREAPDGAGTTTSMTLRWTPPIDGRRGPAGEAARAALEESRHRFDAARLELRGAMRQVYSRWAAATAGQGVAQDLRERVTGLVAVLDARAARGEESELAARRLRLAAVEVASQLAEIEAERLRTVAEAGAWFGTAIGDREPQMAPLPPVPDSIDPEGGAELLARRAAVTRAEAESRLAGRVLSAPELTVGWQRVTEAGPTSDGPVLGLSWPLPLFDRRSGDRVAASGRLAAARGGQELAVRLARGQAEGRLAAYAVLRRQAEEGLDVTSAWSEVVSAGAARYQAGESSVTELIDTIRGALSSRLAAIELYRTATEAHLTLEEAAGRPLPLTEGEVR